ncbi:MAG: Branched-chain amino acid transport ATP-binding protein LivG [Mycobacterium sp.]|nr:Branched-chain amino acid transport ATP-binding protein LivG [Mycobacterium sp.]
MTISATPTDLGAPPPQMADAVLEARGIGKRFGGVTALDDVSLSVAAGEVCGVIGPNGAGKTTLFDVLSGVQPASAGRVIYQGSDITGRTAMWRARRGLKRTFQKQQPFSHLTVEDNLMVAVEWRGGGGGVVADLVRFPLRKNRERSRREAARTALSAFGLESLARERAGRLTIGQIRLLEMARAVVDDPKVLLLDEPTSGLDEREIDYLAQALDRIRADMSSAVLLVEHDMAFVMRECSRVVVLNLGRRLAEGSPDEIRRHPEVAAAYLGSSAA